MTSDATQPAPPDPARAPIFVVGSGRSGTTLLRQMLNAHPRIHLSFEASFYSLAAEGPARELSASAWLRRYLQGPRFAWLRIPAETLLAAVPEGELGRERLPEVFAAIMRSVAARYGKPRYGDKTPGHCAHLRQILADFPDARVVHIVRDPRGAVASLQRMPWTSSSLLLNSGFCLRQVQAVLPFRRQLCEVRLEDLLSDPRRQLERILSFVGEPWDDAVLDYVAHAPVDDLPPFPWFEGARRPLRVAAGPPRWTQELSPTWIRMIELMHAQVIGRYGYPTRHSSTEPGALRGLGALLADSPRALVSLLRLWRLSRLRRRVPPPDPTRAMKALLNLNPGAWKRFAGFEIPALPEPLPGPERSLPGG